MPRPIIRARSPQAQVDLRLDVGGRQETTGRLAREQSLRLLARRRSRTYLDALAHLDAGPTAAGRQELEQLAKAVDEEFGQVDFSALGSQLIGFVERCDLGAPYEVHTYCAATQIVVHYPRGNALPGGLERYRGLVSFGGYAAVEVYTDCVRTIAANGSVSELPGSFAPDVLDEPGAVPTRGGASEPLRHGL